MRAHGIANPASLRGGTPSSSKDGEKPKPTRGSKKRKLNSPGEGIKGDDDEEDIKPKKEQLIKDELIEDSGLSTHLDPSMLMATATETGASATPAGAALVPAGDGDGEVLLVCEPDTKPDVASLIDHGRTPRLSVPSVALPAADDYHANYGFLPQTMPTNALAPGFVGHNWLGASQDSGLGFWNAFPQVETKPEFENT